MKRLCNILLAPNTWVAVFAVLAVMGMAAQLVGALTRASAVRAVGFWLAVPFLAFGLLLAVSVVPLLLAKRFFNAAPRTRQRPTMAGGRSAEHHEQVPQWSEWMRNRAIPDTPPDAPPEGIIAGQLFQGDHGILLCREAVPLVLAADPRTLSVPPQEVPCIHPDYGAGRLVIRQALERVPSGIVEVFVVRLREDKQVERFPPVRIPLERSEPPHGAPYWYADVSLNSLIGEFRPGDDFIYCVEAAPAA